MRVVRDPIEFPKHSGWVWTRSIGLLYGTGPNGEVASVSRPRMTSPWWVSGPVEGVDYVPVFTSEVDAMRDVALQNIHRMAQELMVSPRELMRLLEEAYELLDNARPHFTDPGLARQWGRDRRKFKDAVISRRGKI